MEFQIYLDIQIIKYPKLFNFGNFWLANFKINPNIT